jgi:ADP-ribosyl-[dinitrogen reductase] hydrolase
MPESLTGLLLGCAVGDALGLPAENMSPGRIRRRWKGDWRMRLVFGSGMFSDDTEHTLLVSQALLTQPKNPGEFQRCLAWKLRWWFAGLPGGVGLATARACLKLWLGFPPRKAGVRSAGAGPAMRSAIIGAFFWNNSERRRAFAEASTEITHRSWQADAAALAVAECAAFALQPVFPPRDQILSRLRDLSSEREWNLIFDKLERALAANASVPQFAEALGLSKGVSGYSLHVVPVAIYAWLRHPSDFHGALIQSLDCGGDTDTVGAIVGALAGACVGKAGIPSDWLNNIAEWPRSTRFIDSLGARLVEQSSSKTALGAIRYFWPAILPRNLAFLLIVLAHGFRRLVPPY